MEEEEKYMFEDLFRVLCPGDIFINFRDAINKMKDSKLIALGKMNAQEIQNFMVSNARLLEYHGEGEYLRWIY
jgi:hypothetical protein